MGVRRDDSTSIKQGPDAFITIKGRKRPVITTKGWDVQIKWKDGSVSWHPLSFVKRSKPIDLAEYMESNGLSIEPAFCWRVKHILKKGVKSLVNLKFGIKVPATVEEAVMLDAENGDTPWQNAINKEWLTIE